MYLCIEFQEKYKCLDLLCKDCYSSQEGVSEYIRIMKEVTYKDSKLVESWEYDLKQLLHVRWVRNQLAHEVGSFEAGICTESDLDWVNDFYQRIINGTDPLTLLRKAKEDKRETVKASNPIEHDGVKVETNGQFNENESQKENRKSFLHSILNRFKKWFGK